MIYRLFNQFRLVDMFFKIWQMRTIFYNTRETDCKYGSMLIDR